MSRERQTGKKIKKEVLARLCEKDFKKGLELISRLPPKKVISPLFSFFYNREELIRWRAVTAMGRVVSSLFVKGEKEAARIVMRRLMWNLNDESGGIGWGSPEAMGEITAVCRGLALEFNRILGSYLMEEGNYLEHEILQRGLLWGVGRLSHAHPDLISFAAKHIIPFTESGDPFHRGLAARALGPIKDQTAKPYIKKLLDDNEKLSVYEDGIIITKKVSDLAKQALDEKILPISS